MSEGPSGSGVASGSTVMAARAPPPSLWCMMEFELWATLGRQGGREAGRQGGGQPTSSMVGPSGSDSSSAMADETAASAASSGERGRERESARARDRRRLEKDGKYLQKLGIS